MQPRRSGKQELSRIEGAYATEGDQEARVGSNRRPICD